MGAHLLEGRLDVGALETFKTGVDYQLYHALAILVLAALFRFRPDHILKIAYLMVAGIVLFSGSLYALALTDWRWVAFLTPLGVVCFLSAWLWLAFGFFGRD